MACSIARLFSPGSSRISQSSAIRLSPVASSLNNSISASGRARGRYLPDNRGARHSFATSSSSHFSYYPCAVPLALKPSAWFSVRHVQLFFFLLLVVSPPSMVLCQLKILSPPSLVKNITRDHHTSDAFIQGTTATFGFPSYGEVIIGKLIFIDSPSQFCENDVSIRENGTVTITTSDEGDQGESEVPASSSSTTFGHTSGSNSTSDPSSTPHEAENSTVSVSKASPNISTLDHHLYWSSSSFKNIYLIRRGRCSFVTKVRHAEKNHADAVIIVDNPASKWSPSDIKHIIMADNDKGQDIVIPSILVANSDGEPLINSAQSPDNVVFAELEWSIPRKSVVDVDFWTDSGNPVANQFLIKFAHHAKLLAGHLRFNAHYFIFGLPDNNTEMCLPANTSFCAETPHHQVPVDISVEPVRGRDVVEEDLRQMCLFKLTAENVAGFEDSLWSLQFWRYLEIWGSSCRINGTDPENRFGRVCAEKVLSDINVSVDDVNKCMSSPVGIEMLQTEKENQAWSVLAMRINDIRFSGHLEPKLVTKAICAAFEKQPDGCVALLAEVEESVTAKIRSKVKAEVTEATSNSVNTPSGLFLIVVFLGIIVCGSLYLYQLRLRRSLRESLRKEVMMEVLTQMQEYHQMPEDGSIPENYRQNRPLISY